MYTQPESEKAGIRTFLAGRTEESTHVTFDHATLLYGHLHEISATDSLQPHLVDERTDLFVALHLRQFRCLRPFLRVYDGLKRHWRH